MSPVAQIIPGRLYFTSLVENDVDGAAKRGRVMETPGEWESGRRLYVPIDDHVHYDALYQFYVNSDKNTQVIIPIFRDLIIYF
jgi:hypothetical protein